MEVWLRQPLVDLSAILRRQNAVAKLVENTIHLDKLRDEGLKPLRGLDIDKLAYQLISTGSAAKAVEEAEATRERGESAQPCKGIGSTAKALEILYNLYLFTDKWLPPLLDAMEELLGGDESAENDLGGEECALRAAYLGLHKTSLSLRQAMELAERVIDLDAAPRNYIVNANLGDDLYDLKDELDRIDAEKNDILLSINEKWADITGKGHNCVKLEDVEKNQNTDALWQFRLVDTNAGKELNANFDESDLKVHRILKNGIYFTTKQLRQLGTEKKDKLVEYEERQREIVTNCMAVAATYVPILEGASVLLAELDVLASLAYAAAYCGGSQGYCRPEMTDGEEDGLGIEVSCFFWTMFFVIPMEVTSGIADHGAKEVLVRHKLRSYFRQSQCQCLLSNWFHRFCLYQLSDQETLVITMMMSRVLVCMSVPLQCNLFFLSLSHLANDRSIMSSSLISTAQGSSPSLRRTPRWYDIHGQRYQVSLWLLSFPCRDWTQHGW